MPVVQRKCFTELEIGLHEVSCGAGASRGGKHHFFFFYELSNIIVTRTQLLVLSLGSLTVLICSFSPRPFSTAAAGDAGHETSAGAVGAPEEVGAAPTGAGAGEAAPRAETSAAKKQRERKRE